MNSRNETELRSMWVQWRNMTGKKMRGAYRELAEIMNEVATINGIEIEA